MGNQVGLYPRSIGAGDSASYMGVENDQMVQFDTSAGARRFSVWTYQAYNIFGLIATESNGVAVADVDANRILLDEEAKQDWGWFGASEKQVQRFREVCSMSWEEFQAFANQHPRSRFAI